jgi:hypothetical protein
MRPKILKHWKLVSYEKMPIQHNARIRSEVLRLMLIAPRTQSRIHAGIFSSSFRRIK